MKVCPVCQYEEEDDSEVSCSICGSDLEVEGSSVKEITEESTNDEVPIDNKEVESASVPSEDSDIGKTEVEEEKTEVEKDTSTETNSEELPEMTDGEKEMEEALAATEIPSSEKKEGFDLSKSFLSNVSDFSTNFVTKLDGFFKKDGKLTYASPLAALFVSILIFFSVLAVAAMSIPRAQETNLDNKAIYIQNGPSYDKEVTPTSEPSSGEPFSCEMWDKERYSEYKNGKYMITDTNNSGEIDDDERYGCPIKISLISGSLILILNLILLTLAFYLYKSIPNTSLTFPILLFGFIQVLLFVIYGGLLHKLIFALPLTFGFASAVCLIVSVSVLFGRISLERPLDEPVSLNFYFFVIVIALLLSSIFVNYAQGPYAVCEDPYSQKPTQYEKIYDYGIDGVENTNDKDGSEGNGLLDTWDSFEDYGTDGILSFDTNGDGDFSPAEFYYDNGTDQKLNFTVGEFNEFNEPFEDYGRDGIEKVDYDNDGNYTHVNDTAPDEGEGNGILDWEDENDNGTWDEGEGELWVDQNGNGKWDLADLAPDSDGSENNGLYDCTICNLSDPDYEGEFFVDTNLNGVWDAAELAPDEDRSEGNRILDWDDIADNDGNFNGKWDEGEGEKWQDDNGDGKWTAPENFQDTNGNGRHEDNYTTDVEAFLNQLSEMDESEIHACHLLVVDGENVPHRNVGVAFVDFSGGHDTTIMLLAATFLFIGIGNWLVSSTRINDLDEAKYMTMIISGLVLQYLIFAYNMLMNEGSGFGLDQSDLTLTAMALGISSVGLYSFYNKRKGEQGSIGIAYFAIFAVGIFSLFATFLLPIALGGVEMDEMDGDAKFNLILSALVTAVGFWLVYKFGSQRLREMSLATDRAMPNREDPFAPTVDGGQKAMPEWSVDSAMEFLMQEYGDEFQIELKHTTEHTPDLELVEKTMMDTVDQSVEIREAIEVDYEVDFHEIAEAYSTTRETVDEVITHLTSGKNIMLFGEPGTGKTALSNILLSKLCGEIDQPNGSKAPNYTIVTANAEWSNFDVIGGISPDDSGGYYFKDGYVAEAAKLCEKSIRETGRPHYLVIDEFNRANIDEAFGKLFTVFEYRDKQPLLTHKETGGAPFMMPPEFRIIGTMNTQDKNTLFNVGFALMRRFAFVEIGLPLPEDEYHRMPVFVYFKLKKLGLVPKRAEGDELWKFGEKCRHYPSRKFDFYDDDGAMYKCHEKLVKFLAPGEAPKRGDEVAVGVRTFRKIGPALVIDSMVTIFNSIKKYGPELALDRVIRSNIMPSLEGLERNEIRSMYLQAKEVLGPDSLVTETLDRMANSDSLSLF